MKYTACLVMDVILDRYIGDWQSAIDEAFRISKIIGIPVKLVYANQKVFFITPDSSDDEINELKQKRVVIGV